MTDTTAYEKAKLLISAVTNELALGTKHFDKSGALLATPKEILSALLNGPITIKPVPERREIFNGYE